MTAEFQLPESWEGGPHGFFDGALKLQGDFEQMKKDKVKHCPGGKDHA